MQMTLTINCTTLRNNHTNMHKNSVVIFKQKKNNERNLKMENEITQAKFNFRVQKLVSGSTFHRYYFTSAATNLLLAG